MGNAKRERYLINKIASNLSFEVHRFFHVTTHVSVAKNNLTFCVTSHDNTHFKNEWKMNGDVNSEEAVIFLSWKVTSHTTFA